MSKKLNQVLAIEKGIKTKAHGMITELHRTTQKSDLFEGFTKTYAPLNDDSKTFPPESKKVTVSADEAINTLSSALTELFDITASKDWANTQAKADVVVDGKVILTGVPSTYLLFLDKQLTDLQTFVGKFAELDPSVDWKVDGATGMFKSEPVTTHRTEKVQEPLVLFPATVEHPAQTQLITKDVIIGHWHTTRFSGAMARPRKAAILERIQKLHRSVKEALEAANMTAAEPQRVGESVLKFLFA